jgi:hypothetical protein
MYHVLPVLFATTISSTIGYIGDNGEKVQKMKPVAVIEKMLLRGEFRKL